MIGLVRTTEIDVSIRVKTLVKVSIILNIVENLFFYIAVYYNNMYRHGHKKSRGGRSTSQIGGATGGLTLQSGFIYGPYVLANVPIQAIGTLTTGELVYMIYNDSYTKMVSASGAISLDVP